MQSNPTCVLKPQQLLPLSYDMFRSAGELYGERVAVSGKGKKITEPLGVLVTEKRWPSCFRVPIWSRGWSTQREDVCVLYLVSLAGSLVNTPRPFLTAPSSCSHRAPQLSPLDFFFWIEFKKETARSLCSSCNSCRIAIAFGRRVSQNVERHRWVFQKVGKAWVRKLKACVPAKGWFFERHRHNRPHRADQKQVQNAPLTRI